MGAMHADKSAEAALLHVFKITFPASLFLEMIMISMSACPETLHFLQWPYSQEMRSSQTFIEIQDPALRLRKNLKSKQNKTR